MNLAYLNAGETSLRWLDVFGLTTVLACLWLGARRGLWWQLVRLCGVIAAIAVARAVAPRVSPDVLTWFPELSPRLANGLIWFAVIALAMLAVALVGRIGQAALDATALAPLDRCGGALAGALSGTLIHVALVVVLCQVATLDWTARAIEGTRSQALVAALGRGVPRLLDAHARDALAAER